MADSPVANDELGTPEVEMEAMEKTPEMKDRKLSWGKLRCTDSLNLEAGRVFKTHGHGHHSSQVHWMRTLSLVFQSIGVVYGDIGTSPLYVYASTFGNQINNKEDILGVLSLIIYTIVLIPLIKYVFIVILANDKGGTFALYSLICQYAKVSLTLNDQPEDIQGTNYKLDAPSVHLKGSQKIKEKLETSKTAKMILFLVTIMGTSMVIGDGVLTPSISVLSAVGGIKSIGQDFVVVITIVILIALFSLQRFGTDKVGLAFAPIVLVWFSLNMGIGLYNLVKYEIGVLRALYPKYVLDYFRRNGKQGWTSLGGVFLCITGTEAMFADLGHFNVRTIQISFSFIAFPALAATYIGQAAFLTQHMDKVSDTFYASLPGPVYWPTFVAAVAATIVASQAMISGAFSIVQQSLTIGCFPRVKVIHTSAKNEGQVYIPEINYSLMVLCIIITAIFKTTDKIGNAYGIAVVMVMLITTCMVTLIMLVVWKTNIWLIILFFVGFGSIELIYLSSVLSKFVEGGYLPLVFAVVLMTIMLICHYVHKKRHVFELNNKESSNYIRDLAENPDVTRIPGIGIVFSELVQGVPPIFAHFISNIPAIHSVIVIVLIKNLPISRVLPEERFLFQRVKPRNFRMFRCVVRHGFNDSIQELMEFERSLVESLQEFIRLEHCLLEESAISDQVEPEPPSINPASRNSRDSSSGEIKLAVSSTVHSAAEGLAEVGLEVEIQFIQDALEKGVVYLMGEPEVVAEPKSSLLKKLVVNYAYSFLRKISRQDEKAMVIPRSRLLRVGMTYEI